jgi:hypothetical protein
VVFGQKKDLYERDMHVSTSLYMYLKKNDNENNESLIKTRVYHSFHCIFLSKLY